MELEINDDESLKNEFKNKLKHLEPLNEEDEVSNTLYELLGDDTFNVCKNTEENLEEEKQPIKDLSSNYINKKESTFDFDQFKNITKNLNREDISKICKELISLSTQSTIQYMINILQSSQSNSNSNTKQDKNRLELLKEHMITKVSEINSVLDDSQWNNQIEKSNTLQHQLDSHRSYLFDHTLGRLNKRCKRIECLLGRLPNVNYFKYIKTGG